MSDSPVKQTVAWKIVKQIVDHVYGSKEKLDDAEFLHVYRIFCGAGGSWEAVMAGDLDEIVRLEGSIERFLKWRNTMRVARRVAGA